MKKIMTLMACFLMVTATPMFAQSSDNTSSSSTTNTSSSYNSSQTAPQDNPPMNITGIAIGAVAVLALALVVFFMVRNRKSSIGGIQSQDKADPRPVTTQSINNPGSGV